MSRAKITIPQIISGVFIALFIIGWLCGCAWFIGGMADQHKRDQGPDKSEYVGVWACYETKLSDSNAKYEVESLDKVSSYLRLMQNGNAEIVVYHEGSKPYITEGKWRARARDREARTDTGIVINGTDEDFENPYSYFDIGKDDAELVDSRLIAGDLAIDYGYRKEYFEKISNDSDYTPWSSVGEINEKKPGSSEARAQSFSIPSGAIEWSKASQYVGKTATFYGKVMDSEYASGSNGKPTFLDVGAAYPDNSRLSVVIWGKNRNAFSYDPESAYKGKTIAVTGKVYRYNGSCNIEVSSPSQIEVLD